MAFVVVSLLQLFIVILIVRAVLSFFQPGYDSPVRPVADAVFRVTEPVLAPVRRILPPMGGLDFSVLLVIIVIQVVVIPLAYALLP